MLSFTRLLGRCRHSDHRATGIVLGYLGMTIVIAAGLGALVASTPVALTVLTVIGARIPARAVSRLSGFA
jgi:threonine/homoserine/homoserine lactone efflux protein